MANKKLNKLFIFAFIYLFMSPVWGSHAHHISHFDYNLNIKQCLSLCEHNNNCVNHCKSKTYFENIFENGAILKKFNIDDLKKQTIFEEQFFNSLLLLPEINIKKKFILNNINTSKEFFLLASKSKRSPPQIK